MEYIIGVLMSVLPWWPAIAGGALLGLSVAVLHNASKIKLSLAGALGMALGIILIFSTAPSNTYKVKAERTPNPVVEMEPAPETGVDIQIKKEEDIKRKEHFDNLVNWKDGSK